jgi:3-hydroxyacyl-[acyl-carrier-protein] dehydratase
MRFFLIDKITHWKPGVNGRAVKNIALSEDFFEDHFPLKPIMPVEGVRPEWPLV